VVTEAIVLLMKHVVKPMICLNWKCNSKFKC